MSDARRPLSLPHAAVLASLTATLGGVLLALFDFSQSWLWLSWWSERGWFLLRLVALHASVGAVAGALAGTLLWLSPRHDPARLVTLAAVPWLGWIAWRLFEGGTMAALPFKPGLIVVAATLIVGASHVLITLLVKLARRACGSLWWALGFCIAAWCLSKLNQHAYPQHYGYLHGALSVWTLAFASIGAWVGVVSKCSETWLRYWPVPLLAIVIGLSSAVTLNTNQNVKVALHSPRAPASRSFLRALSLNRDSQRATLTAKAARDAKDARQRRLAEAARGNLPIAPQSHVILLTVDALRADRVGAYGYGRGITPNIDALTRHTITFERAYAAAPHSSYSIASLMVSEFVHETTDVGTPLPEHTLATLLSDAGYHTAAFYTEGIFHTEGRRLTAYAKSAFGFERHDHSTYAADALTDAVLEEFTRVVDRGEPPSFVWAHYFDVHEPYEDTSLGPQDRDRYDAEIRNVDRAIGRLVDTLPELLKRDVVLALTADHGEEFKEHGGVYHGSTLYDEQVRVPLILAIPDVKPRRVHSPVSLVDLAPTLLAVAEVQSPVILRGRDLRPRFFSEEPEPVFAAVSHKKMVVDWPHKLIADLRFGLNELYDLSSDPHERVNLADTDKATVQRLTGEVHAWLDSLNEAQDPHDRALAHGRMRDRRAVPTLGVLMLDPNAPAHKRIEACRLLGHLADKRATAALRKAMSLPVVADEAAVALGRLYDPHATDALVALIDHTDRELSARAAVSLARLRDPRAVPGLIAASRHVTDKYERQEITRWLGRLRDPRAFGTLMRLLDDFDTRYLAVIALGHLGDPRAFDTLIELAATDTHATVRDHAARALGQLGDPRAVPTVRAIAANEPDLAHPTEALVRLNAIQTRAIGGTDFSPRLPEARAQLGPCRAGPLIDDWNYLRRTHCRTRSAKLSVPVPLPADANDVALIVSVKRDDASEPAQLTVELGEQALAPVAVDGAWIEHRWRLTAPAQPSSTVTLRVEPPKARLLLDHVLIVPLD